MIEMFMVNFFTGVGIGIGITCITLISDKMLQKGTK